MMIRKYNDFIKIQEVSGTELVGPVGPAYGETRLQNKTVSQTHTSTVGVDGYKNDNSKNDLTSDLFFEDDYIQLYNDYLKSGGSQTLLTGDKAKDITIIKDFLLLN